MSSRDSPIDLGIPETPNANSPHEYEQHLLIYNALRALQSAVDAISSASSAGASVHDRAYAFFISGTR